MCLPFGYQLTMNVNLLIWTLSDHIIFYFPYAFSIVIVMFADNKCQKGTGGGNNKNAAGRPAL